MTKKRKQLNTLSIQRTVYSVIVRGVEQHAAERGMSPTRATAEILAESLKLPMPVRKNAAKNIT
jgi:hypothetical protein